MRKISARVIRRAEHVLQDPDMLVGLLVVGQVVSQVVGQVVGWTLAPTLTHTGAAA